jgi:alanine dehydrogenase
MQTMLLNRENVAGLLTIDECIAAVESAFRAHAQGKALPPKVLGIHVANGGFHIKAGVMALRRKYFVAKINSNFPGNSKQSGLPTIQGVIAVCDAEDGKLLALMDSVEITIIITGAATAVATKYLALPTARTVTICGCGNQGAISLRAIMKVRALQKAYVFDIEDASSETFSRNFSDQLQVIPVKSNELATALSRSEIVVTCTPSRHPYVQAKDIMPGTFIAAVGADSEEKQELCADLVASGKVVVDLVEQSSKIGELHHAIGQNKMTIDDVHAELGMILAGQKPARESATEIIIFDSTGMALQDVAAASIVYEKALTKNLGMNFNFVESSGNDHEILKQKRPRAGLTPWFPFR